MSAVSRKEFLRKVSAYPKLYMQLIQSGHVKEVKDGRRVKVVDDRTIKNDDGTYNVKPILVTPSSMYVVCPYCGEIHKHNIHGIPEGGCDFPTGDHSGSRLSHCDYSGDSYRIELVIA